jgi:hypothetical protein
MARSPRFEIITARRWVFVKRMEFARKRISEIISLEYDYEREKWLVHLGYCFCPEELKTGNVGT